MDPLESIVVGAYGVFMFAVILNWFDRWAIRVSPGDRLPAQWVVWAKRFTTDRKTGIQFSYYILVVRLPSYAWGYAINIDGMAWRQNAIVWHSRDPNPGYEYPGKGFRIAQLDPIESRSGGSRGKE
jgi:hypothetical protein